MKCPSIIYKFILILLGLSLFSCHTACKRSPEDQASTALEPIVLQTDWFPQPEHGGFYQALAKGYYREAGLEVTILPGGPNSMSTQKVLSGRAHFAMNRADTIYSLASRDVPITLVMATLQTDPQGILLHQSDPAHSIQEMDGRSVMAIPGLTWIKWVEAKYDISLEIVPHDFGLERFLNDPTFAQQCLVTNEPFYAQQAGIATKVIRLNETGFNPYHGVYCLNELLSERPELVQRFVQASVRGWKDFISNDPTPAFQLISERNPRMTQAFMEFSYAAMHTQQLVTGPSGEISQVGQLDPQRLLKMADELQVLGIVETPDIQPVWFSTDFIPQAATP